MGVQMAVIVDDFIEASGVVAFLIANGCREHRRSVTSNSSSSEPSQRTGSTRHWSVTENTHGKVATQRSARH